MVGGDVRGAVKPATDGGDGVVDVVARWSGKPGTGGGDGVVVVSRADGCGGVEVHV